jgi:hypothetical protein
MHPGAPRTSSRKDETDTGSRCSVPTLTPSSRADVVAEGEGELGSGGDQSGDRGWAAAVSTSTMSPSLAPAAQIEAFIDYQTHHKLHDQQSENLSRILDTPTPRSS